jgi:hypothetical protein
VTEPELFRRLSISIVDALHTQGRILVVKGRSVALARELEAKIVADIAALAPRIRRRTHLDGEVTSTFGDEAVDEAIEALVEKLTSTLMDSEHVEDVFADDNVIQRDIFRVLHDGLLGSAGEEDEGAAVIQVRLDTLGYVASTVGKRAPEATLREALGRAAVASGGALTDYDRETREAVFALRAPGPDARLDLEEAVADELVELVEANVVALPTAVRRIDLGRPIPSALLSKIDAAAARTLGQSGCAASWELEDDGTLSVIVTPLSEQDALDVDGTVALFGRQIAALLNARPKALEEPPLPEPAASEGPPPAPAKKAAAKKTAATKAAATKTATTKAAATKTATTKAAAKKTATTKAATTKAATTKASAAKKTAAKKR